MTPQQLEDERRKYDGTVVTVYHKPSKEYGVLYIDHILTDRDIKDATSPIIIMGCLQTPSGIKMVDEHIPYYDVRILPMPKSRMIDTPVGAMYYERKPERQWRRGICKNNSYMFNITKLFVANICDIYNVKRIDKLEIFLYGTENMIGLVKDNPSFEEAVKKLEKGEAVSVAVDREMAVSTAVVS